MEGVDGGWAQGAGVLTRARRRSADALAHATDAAPRDLTDLLGRGVSPNSAARSFHSQA